LLTMTLSKLPKLDAISAFTFLKGYFSSHI
jgi:hypothetical protein